MDIFKEDWGFADIQPHTEISASLIFLRDHPLYYWFTSPLVQPAF